MSRLCYVAPSAIIDHKIQHIVDNEKLLLHSRVQTILQTMIFIRVS